MGQEDPIIRIILVYHHNHLCLVHLVILEDLDNLEGLVDLMDRIHLMDLEDLTNRMDLGDLMVQYHLWDLVCLQGLEDLVHLEVEEQVSTD